MLLPPATRARLMARLYDILASLCESPGPTVDTLIAAAGQVRVSLIISSRSTNGQRRHGNAAREASLAERILSAIADDPQTAEALARKVGRRLNSHFRALLARLVDAGHVLRTSRGYRLPT